MRGRAQNGFSHVRHLRIVYTDSQPVHHRTYIYVYMRSVRIHLSICWSSYGCVRVWLFSKWIVFKALRVNVHTQIQSWPAGNGIRAWTLVWLEPAVAALWTADERPPGPVYIPHGPRNNKTTRTLHSPSPAGVSLCAGAVPLMLRMHGFDFTFHETYYKVTHTSTPPHADTRTHTPTQTPHLYCCWHRHTRHTHPHRHTPPHTNHNARIAGQSIAPVRGVMIHVDFYPAFSGWPGWHVERAHGGQEYLLHHWIIGKQHTRADGPTCHTGTATQTHNTTTRTHALYRFLCRSVTLAPARRRRQRRRRGRDGPHGPSHDWQRYGKRPAVRLLVWRVFLWSE